MGTIYRNGVPFVGSGGAGGVEMTQAEYELLPESEKMNGAIYFITDGDVSYPSASQMRYDNTESQIPSTTVQGAIDENRIEINSLKAGLTDKTTMNLTLSNATAGGNASFVTRKGKDVILFLDYTLNTAATTLTICNLQQIYRPATTIRQIVPAVDSENPAGIFFVVVYPDGEIVSYATKPKRGYITLIYPAEN